MRHIRGFEFERYQQIPLNELYRSGLRANATFAASCRVDSCSISKEIKYVRDTCITLEPNTMYNPDSAQNSGWDRLIVMEAFPLSEKSKSKKRFIIPVFIQNKLSCEDASTLLSVSDVTAAHGHCVNFMNRYAVASQFYFLSAKSKWFSTKSRPVETDFILLFVAKRNLNLNTLNKMPLNVMFCSSPELEEMYGPTLVGLIRGLTLDKTVSVVAKLSSG